MNSTMVSPSSAKGRKKGKFDIKDWLVPAGGSDRWLMGAVIVLMIFGSMMVLSSKQGTTVGMTRSYVQEILKQIGFVVVSWGAMVFISRKFDWMKLFNAKTQIFLCLFYILLLFAVQLVGIDVNGSKAWLRLGPLTIQPSEFGKPLLILLLASSARNAGKKHSEPIPFGQRFFLPLFLLLISVFFIGGAQKDFGSLIITLGIGLVGLLATADADLTKVQRYIVIFLFVVLLLLLVGIYFSDWFVTLFRNVPLLRHIAVRIENMKNPYINIHSEGYQPANALYSLGDAGFFGRGFGGSVRKYGFLTQAESDYILAIVIEEFGFFGLLLITVCYCILLWRLLHWALATAKPQFKVMLLCSAAYFLLHFFINIGGVSTLIPMTGVPLLFISAGGSALLAVGIVLGLDFYAISQIQIEQEIEAQKEAEQAALAARALEDDLQLQAMIGMGETAGQEFAYTEPERTSGVLHARSVRRSVTHDSPAAKTGTSRGRNAGTRSRKKRTR